MSTTPEKPDNIASDPELSAMWDIYYALEPLDEGARERVVNYVCGRLGIGIDDGPLSTFIETDPRVVRGGP